MKALDHIDEVIHIIRSSQDDAEAKARLIEAFDFSEKQAQAILDMRLRRLTGLEATRLQEELDTLREQIAYYLRILSEPQLVLDIIKEELTQVRNEYADARRSDILPVEGEVDTEDLIDPEDMCVTLTHFGYIKTPARADTYRIQRRGGRGVSGLTTREEDFVENLFFANTHTPILFFTNKGRVFRPQML